MMCHICKNKEATIRLKEIINNVVTELHLCEECYRQRELKGDAGGGLSPAKMLESAASGKKTSKAARKPRKCPECGMNEDQFRSNGRLGCAQCYRTFEEALKPILSKVHGSTEHRGKFPRPAERSLDLKAELRRLQEDLQEAILSENYERAAKLRDRIKHYENE